MRDLVKRNKEVHPKAIEAMQKHDRVLEIGAWYIKKGSTNRDDTSFDVIQVIDITYNKRYNHTRIEYSRATDWECTEFEKKEMASTDLYYYSFTKLENGLDDFKKYRGESLLVIEGKISVDFYKDQASEAISEERALVSRDSKVVLAAMQQGMEKKKQHAELIKRFVGYEMERRKRDLEEIRKKLDGILADFKKKIVKIERVITSIELYMGIDEEIFQIQEGQRAAQETPITFRQQVLYMDEEIGHWKNGGLDFQNVAWFDKWLTENNNYKKLCPEEKCLVVFRPRRHNKKYSDEAWLDAMLNSNNRQTYLLIRNGDCLFRIYTEKIIIFPRLFPKRKEFEELLAELSELGDSDYRTKEKEDKIESIVYHYKKRALLMQGLIDRSEVFHPLPGLISILKMHQNPEAVQFAYDDEEALTQGQLPFWDWHKKINSKITAGSRVLITGNWGVLRSEYGHDYSERWYGRAGSYNMPEQGVYEIFVKYKERADEIPHYFMEEMEEKGLLIKKGEQVYRMTSGYENYEGHYQPRPGVKVRLCSGPKNNKIPGVKDYIEAYDCLFKEEHLYIKYKEGGDYWSWSDGLVERKNKVSFRVLPRDRFLLNYDQIDLKDIDFYLTSRVDRQNYLWMMPILEKIKTQRLKEYDHEKEFISFVAGRNASKLSGLDEKAIRAMVVESVAWWKYKNKWKRPIVKDDTLALRMIEKRILSKNYHTFKKY
jgi:hypothetical protein